MSKETMRAEGDALPAADVSTASRQVLVGLRDVGYTYDSGTLAIEDISFDLVRGQVLSIVGPSGCGKSTLLRLISGLAAPTTGTIQKDPSLDNPRALTMVFQTDTLLPWLTVRENAALYSRFQGLRERRAEAASRKERVEELIEMVGLSHFAKAYPYQLSGGMRRRLAFITAVSPEPKILMLDEPFASVDEPTRIQIHQDVLGIIRRLNMTVIIVTHDLAEAASLADSVMIMTNRPGRIFREHRIDFGPDRDIVELRARREFLDLYGELWHDLSQQLKKTPPDTIAK
jgi:NitT/TauT family transport system ATP-binding protein